MEFFFEDLTSVNARFVSFITYQSYLYSIYVVILTELEVYVYLLSLLKNVLERKFRKNEIKCEMMEKK